MRETFSFLSVRYPFEERCLQCPITITAVPLTQGRRLRRLPPGVRRQALREDQSDQIPPEPLEIRPTRGELLDLGSRERREHVVADVLSRSRALLLHCVFALRRGERTAWVSRDPETRAQRERERALLSQPVHTTAAIPTPTRACQISSFLPLSTARHDLTPL